jgi:hypothetical protein
MLKAKNSDVLDEVAPSYAMLQDSATLVQAVHPSGDHSSKELYIASRSGASGIELDSNVDNRTNKTSYHNLERRRTISGSGPSGNSLDLATDNGTNEASGSMNKTNELIVMPGEVLTCAPNTAVYEHIMTEFDDS